jgi:hypothetical protein
MGKLNWMERNLFAIMMTSKGQNNFVLECYLGWKKLMNTNRKTDFLHLKRHICSRVSISSLNNVEILVSTLYIFLLLNRSTLQFRFGFFDRFIVPLMFLVIATRNIFLKRFRENSYKCTCLLVSNKKKKITTLIKQRSFQFITGNFNNSFLYFQTNRIRFL